MSHSRARIPRPAPERPIEGPQVVSGRQNGRRRAQWRKRQLTEDVAYPVGPADVELATETRRQSCRMPLSLPGGAAALEPLGRQPGLSPIPAPGQNLVGGVGDGEAAGGLTDRAGGPDLGAEFDAGNAAPAGEDQGEAAGPVEHLAFTA